MIVHLCTWFSCAGLYSQNILREHQSNKIVVGKSELLNVPKMFVWTIFRGLALDTENDIFAEF